MLVHLPSVFYGMLLLGSHSDKVLSPCLCIWIFRIEKRKEKNDIHKYLTLESVLDAEWFLFGTIFVL